LLTVGEARSDGMRTVFFELNGQPRQVEVRDNSIKAETSARRKADPAQPGQVAAPIPGAISTVYVQSGETVDKGDRLLILEAMKMQTTVYAPKTGTVGDVLVKARDSVEAHDLLLTIN
jgi:pyruvate carboxylase